MNKKINIFLIVLAASFIFFSGIIFSEKTFFYSDTTYLFRPFKLFIAEGLRSLSLPQWNPFFNGGMPLVSDPVMQSFYPLNLIFLFFPFNPAYELYVILHYVIAGFFAYLLAYEINCNDKSAIFCALSYSLGGYFIFIHYNLPFLAGGTFLPLFFLGVFRIFSKKSSPSFGGIALTPLAMSMQFFGGDIEIVYIESAILCLLLFFNVTGERRENKFQSFKQRAKYIFFVITIFAGLISALAIPLLYLYPQTTRADGINLGEIYKFSFHPLNFFEFAIPNLLGNATQTDRILPGISPSFTSPASGEWSPYIYCGSIVFLFFIFSILSGRKKRGELFFFSLFIFSFAASCGSKLFIYPLMLKLLPFFSSFRYPGKLLIFSALSISVIASTGFSELINCNDKRKVKKKVFLSAIIYLALCPLSVAFYRLISGKYLPLSYLFNALRLPFLFLVLSVLIIVIFLKERKNGFLILLLLILFTDLWTMGYKNIFLIEDIFFKLKPLALKQIEEADPDGEKWSYRVFRSENFKKGFNYPQLDGKTNIEKSIIFKQNTLKEGTGVKYGTLYLGTYSSYILGNYSKLKNSLNGTKLFMNLMNVRYFITPPDDGARSPYNIIYRHRTEEFTILENREYLPRTFFVKNPLFFKNYDDMLSYMKNNDFYPREQILLKGDNESRDKKLSARDNSYTVNSAGIISYKPDEVKIRTTSVSDSYLLLCDSWFPGWSVFIDGMKSPLLRADYNFRGVFVPAGEHEIVFSFVHPGLSTGIGISLFTFLALFFTAIYRQFFYKKKSDV